ncbi:type II toxin-antitoxin system RelE/ParE family toxin [Dinghuibacter silviterrae]|uniref:Plasmid maintenance system killer protein n=1 Tax=Dinghuibacter silviterrae TaxID=1539049 RepID=A0A4R8DTP6_9BACT|nr:type II toxin-antitoxin system RelE/ParE family toxin [Dinghuibacter silviterrae]TDX01680.1 plasmid maintenance system killer protein [Dinghuibacter silviterrae]
MEVVFRNASLEVLYRSGRETGKPVFGKEVIRSFIRKIAVLKEATHAIELTAFKSLHFEALTKEERFRGMHSIRVNDRYRLVLKIAKEIVEIHELTDYH